MMCSCGVQCHDVQLCAAAVCNCSSMLVASAAVAGLALLQTNHALFTSYVAVVVDSDV
jgi:hypothetical protein